VTTQISPLCVRRAILIHAPPERVWQEFESLEKMQTWYGTGHQLTKFEPRVGGIVETDAGGDEYIFRGTVQVFDPPRELTFEQDWIGHGWSVPSLITLRLTPMDGGTLVELFHHGFERLGGDPAENQRGFEGGWTNRQLEALRERVEA
jgi:uncharacterized protein YndB with AHSA1/START domain